MSMNKVALQEALHKLGNLDESKMRLTERKFNNKDVNWTFTDTYKYDSGKKMKNAKTVVFNRYGAKDIAIKLRNEFNLSDREYQDVKDTLKTAETGDIFHFKFCNNIDFVCDNEADFYDEYRKEYHMDESLKRNTKLRESQSEYEIDDDDALHAKELFTQLFDFVKTLNNRTDVYSYIKEDDLADMNRAAIALHQLNDAYFNRKDYFKKLESESDNRKNESLKRKINECLRSLHEAEMSPEDKADSEVLAKLYTKLQNHPGGRLSKAEQQVMDKYGLTRDAKWIGDDNTTLVGSTIRNTKNVDKVNLADRARKMKTRKNYYPRQMDLRKKTPLEIDREDDNVNMQKPYNDMKREVNYRNRQTNY